jgi:dimeric dUTPase (all-alpha-NTP-PPase superfamily)
MQNIIHKLVVMLQLQSEMNCWVHEDWKSQNFEWYRAIWIEAGEALEHYGWKWWKHQQPDLAQFKLEIVDIVHFMLSIELQSDQELPAIADRIAIELGQPRIVEDIRNGIELLAMETLQDKNSHFDIIAGLMHHLDMDFEDLYKRYVGKNVLNIFRQDHGYKQGKYIKEWNGQEDNEILEGVLARLDENSPKYREDIYTELETLYPSN